MNLALLPSFAGKDLVRVVVETPKGSRNKVSYDPETESFMLSKTLPEGMVFPYDFGFIPQTKGGDGDPLDALVLMPESLPMGCVVDCRLIGVIRARQRERSGDWIRNDRYLAVSDTACEFRGLRRPGDLPADMLAQLEKFFVNYQELEGGAFRVKDIKGPKVARGEIRRAQAGD